MTDIRVLVVDSLSDRREHLVSLLESQGVVAVQAASCEAAESVLQNERIHLVLSETELPKKSGLYLLQETKKHYPDIEVILLTHNSSSFNLLQALRQGAFDFIIRPVDTGEVLFNTLVRAFNHQQQKVARELRLVELASENDRLRQSLRRMETLSQAVRSLAGCSDIQSIFSGMLDATVQEVGAKIGFVALFDPAGENLGIKVSHGISNAVCHACTKRLPDGLTLAMARRAKPVLVPGQLPDRLLARGDEQELEYLLAPPGLLSVPLKINGRIAGVMLVSGHRQNVPFTREDLRFMSQLATHALLLVEKVGQIHQLQRAQRSI